MVVRAVVAEEEDKIVRHPENLEVVVAVVPLVSVRREAVHLQNRVPKPMVVGGTTVAWLRRSLCTTEHQQLADSMRMLSGKGGIDAD